MTADSDRRLALRWDRAGVPAALVTVVLLVVVIGLAAAGGNPVATSPYQRGSGPPPSTASPTLPPITSAPPDIGDAGGWVGLVVVVLLGLAALCILVWGIVLAVRLFRGLRISDVRRRVLEPEEVTSLVNPFPEVDLAGRRDQLQAALTSGLAEVVSGSDVRAAILSAWIRLEEVAESVGTPRLDPDAPADLVDRLLATQHVRADRLERLAELYRLARFSRTELTEADRQVAVRALADVQADLTGTAPEAAPGAPDAQGRWPARW